MYILASKEMTMMAINFEKYNDEEILRLIKSLTHPYPVLGDCYGKESKNFKQKKPSLMELRKVLYLNIMDLILF